MFGETLVSTVHPHILRTQASIVLVADACRYIPKPIAGVNKLIRETCQSGFSGFPPPIQCSASAWGATGRPQAALRSHQLSGASPNKQLWWALVPAILGLWILIPSACSLFGTLGYHRTPTNPLSQNAGMLAHSCRGTRGWGGHNTSGEAVGAIVPATRMCVFTNGNSGCSGLGGMDFKMEPWMRHIGWGTGKRHVDCRLFTTAPDGFVLLPWRIWRGVWWVSPWRLRREGLPLPSRCVSELLQQVTLLNFAGGHAGSAIWVFHFMVKCAKPCKLSRQKMKFS